MAKATFNPVILRFLGISKTSQEFYVVKNIDTGRVVTVKRERACWWVRSGTNTWNSIENPGHHMKCESMRDDYWPDGYPRLNQYALNL